MASLSDFKRHFGEYKVIKDFKGGLDKSSPYKGDNMAKEKVFKVKQKIDVISVNPSQYGGNHYKIVATDGEQFSTFDKTAGEQLKGIKDGDIVDLEYFVNSKGFKTFTSVKLLDDDKGFQQELPEDDKDRPPVQQRRSVDRLDKNCISAMQGALGLMAFFDFTKFSEEKVVEKFMELWKLLEEEIGG